MILVDYIQVNYFSFNRKHIKSLNHKNLKMLRNLSLLYKS